MRSLVSMMHLLLLAVHPARHQALSLRLRLLFLIRRFNNVSVGLDYARSGIFRRIRIAQRGKRRQRSCLRGEKEGLTGLSTAVEDLCNHDGAIIKTFLEHDHGWPNSTARMERPFGRGRTHAALVRQA